MHKTPRTSAKHRQKSDIPKSKPVQELETIISKLSSQTGPARDPKGGCFCLVREHPLSKYTPSCRSCAFILCSLNSPYYLCPSCSSPLLTTPAISSLIDDLKIKLEQTLEAEERERQRLVEEAKRAAGAFPQLSAPNKLQPKTSAPQLRPAQETGHKILSLTSNKGKQKIKVISHTPTPTSSRPSSGTSTPLHNDAQIIRVPPPPSTIDYARGKSDQSRPWRNFLIGGDDIKYIPPERRQVGES